MQTLVQALDDPKGMVRVAVVAALHRGDPLAGTPRCARRWIRLYRL